MKTLPLDRPITMLAADFSLRSPALAILTFDPRSERIRLKHVVDLDNRDYGSPYGFLLERIFKTLCPLFTGVDVFVREGLYMDGSNSTRALAEVEGVANLALWQVRKSVFIDIPATKVKQLVAGRGNATKEVVASNLPRFVGTQPYTSTDHSDAVAVGVAWLIQTGRIDMQYNHTALGLPDESHQVIPISIPCERSTAAYAKKQLPENSICPAGCRPVVASPCPRPVVG